MINNHLGMFHFMQSISLGLTVTLMILLGSCDKQEGIDMDTPCVLPESDFSQDTNFYMYESGMQEFGWASGVKNNKPWEASARAIFKDEKILLWFRTFLIPDIRYDAEYFEFKGIPFEVGCYDVYSNCNSSTDNSQCVESIFMALDDDAIEDYYLVHESSTRRNILEIDSILHESKRITGKISVTYQVEDGVSNKKYNPELVRIFNVEFECDLEF